MKFKGDIIITDPCYIIKDLKENAKELGITLKYPDAINISDFKELDRQLKEYNNLRNQCDDWYRCQYGDYMEVLGFTTYISESTLYGDWNCTTFECNPDELLKFTNEKHYVPEGIKKLGNFCADAGMVAVFLLEEVLKYNPKFDYYIKNPWTTTWIKDFDGDIEYIVSNEEAHIIGKGNINFLTLQTGL